MIELSLTIEIYIAGVKNRAGFATGSKTAQYIRVYNLRTNICQSCWIFETH